MLLWVYGDVNSMAYCSWGVNMVMELVRGILEWVRVVAESRRGVGAVF